MIVKPPPNLSSFIHEDEPVPGWVSGGGGRAARAVCSIYSIQYTAVLGSSPVQCHCQQPPQPVVCEQPLQEVIGWDSPT